MKKNYALTKKWSIRFICFMLFCTFSSRTINYMLTPKVTVKQIKGGKIVDKKQLDKVEIVYTDIETIRLPAQLTSRLYVKQLLSYERKIIKKGEPLLTLDLTDCSILLQDLNQKVNILKRQYECELLKKRHIEDQYVENSRLTQHKQDALIPPTENDIELKKLKLDREKVNTKYNQKKAEFEIYNELYSLDLCSKNELEVLRQEVNSFVSELDLCDASYTHTLTTLKNTYDTAILDYEVQKQELLSKKEADLLNVKDTDALLAEYTQLNNTYSELSKLLETGQLLSPIDGIIDEIRIDKHSYIEGGQVLFTIICRDSDMQYRVPIDKNQETYLSNEVRASLKIQQQLIPVEIIGLYKEAEHFYLLFKPDTPLTKEQQQIALSLVLEHESPYYNTIIPSEALIENNVFVLIEEDKGFWGTYYYVEKTPVNTGIANVSQVGITSGLTENQRVVVSWDRALENQQRVMLNLE